jgi:molybdopterin biosynthesis enzyme MoaB
LGFSPEEKEKFEKKVSDFCYSIQAISKVITEDGKQKVGVYVVLDDKENINQQTVFEAIDKVAEMYEKTSRFLLKTF